MELLTVIAPFFEKIKGIFGSLRPSCWGAMSYDKAKMEWAKWQTEQWKQKLISDYTNIPAAQAMSFEIVSHLVGMYRDKDNLKNACSKENCLLNIQMFEQVRDVIMKVYNWTSTTSYVQHGNWGQLQAIWAKPYSTKPEYVNSGVEVVVNNPPTSPPVTPPYTPPPTNPPYTPPSTPPPTNPPYIPPVEPPYTPPTTTPPYTPPVDTTPYYPPTTTTPPVGTPSGGLTRTETDNGDGTKTIFLWNPDGSLYKSTKIIITSTTSNLTGGTPVIDIGGQVGDWTFGASNNQSQTMLIAGGLGVLGLILLMSKNKK